MKGAIRSGLPLFFAVILGLPSLLLPAAAPLAESPAQASPVPDPDPDAARTQFFFRAGMVAVDEGRYDDAIQAFRTILVRRPELVRVRLELARAFFLKGEDDLAREHFERVLAGGLPLPVATNVRRYLAQIRARRRWTMYVGAALAPDSNIGAASDEEIIYIFDLPFRRGGDEHTTSGVGVSVWMGGEYQYPVEERLRLRMGADLSRQEHSGRDFDQTSGALHFGPRWLASPRTDLSLLASAQRHWAAGEPQHDDRGFRFEFRHRPTPGVTLNARTSWHDRRYRRRAYLDGPRTDATLSASWVVTPTVRADAALGIGRERPESRSWRNRSRWVRTGVSVALPFGFTAGGSVQVRQTDYEGSWWPFVREDDRSREDRTRTLSGSLYHRAFTLYGFSPQLVLTRDERTSNAQLHGYERTRGELRFVRQF